MLRRESDRLSKSQRIPLAHIGGGCPAFDLVCREDNRLARFAQLVSDDFVPSGHAFAAVDYQQADIGFANGGAGLLHHARRQAFAACVLETGCVDEAQIERAELRLRLVGGSREARRIVDVGDAPAGERVEQRRLPDIGPADNGEGERHRDSA